MTTAAFAGGGHDKKSPHTIQWLDKHAVFSFAIMSDHKGLSPVDSEPFARMTEWIKEDGDQFVIGLGDHLKIDRPNTFLNFLKENAWWHENFYPNVADGENEYYGKDQNAWGAGAPFLDVVDMKMRPNVSIGENGCEYYAKINAAGYTIHLIQLHFPDHPREDRLSFREKSKIYMENILRNMDKGPKDIVIVAAHSISGFWMESLTQEQKDLVAQKCDLALSATTHHFERKKLSEYGDRGALMINTGSITYADEGSVNGYVRVHVLENPLRLDVKYINVDDTPEQMPGYEYAYTKIVGGKSKYTLPAAE